MTTDDLPENPSRRQRRIQAVGEAEPEDYCSKPGARLLEEMIRQNAASAGHPLVTWIEELVIGDKAVWVIRSKPAQLQEQGKGGDTVALIE